MSGKKNLLPHTISAKLVYLRTHDPHSFDIYDEKSTKIIFSNKGIQTKKQLRKKEWDHTPSPLRVGGNFSRFFSL